MLRKRTKRSNLADEIPSSTTPPNWDDYPVPPQPAMPVQHVDANACSTSSTRIAAQPDASVCSDDAHTAAQYTEEQGQRLRCRQERATMQVESTGFPIQNVKSTQSHSIQTAYALTPAVTQQPQSTTLRRSNVDGNFYSHEFDHEEVMEAMDESRSQISSVDEPWNRVFEAPKRVYPTPNGSLRERTLPSVRVQELAEPVHIPPLHSSKGSLRERTSNKKFKQAIKFARAPVTGDHWRHTSNLL